MSKEQDRAMLREWLARVQQQASHLDTLVAQDADQHMLVTAMGELSYAIGVVQGSAALYIAHHAPRVLGAHAHNPPP